MQYIIQEGKRTNASYYAKIMVVAKDVLEGANDNGNTSIETIKYNIEREIKERYARINTGWVLDYVNMEIINQQLIVTKRQLVEKNESAVILLKITEAL